MQLINNPIDYKVAMYIRLSKEDDYKKAESESVTNQKSLLKNFIRENKLELIDIYIDDGVSGTTFDRPDFNRLIKDINNKKINMVVTKDLSRLGRDYIQTGFYLEKFFPENSVRYISLLDGIDTGVENSANDITPFKAIMNDMYAKDISKKITSVKRDKQKKGLYIGGKPCYGYKMNPNEKNKIIIDEEVAINVRRAFKLALEGYSGRSIAQKFTDENIATPSKYAGLKYKGTSTSHFWKSEFIKIMLRNEMYIGNMVQGRRRKLSYKSKKEIKMPKEQWVVVKNTHEPIIEKEIFDKVQTIINKQIPMRENVYDYLLKGLVFCHECGSGMCVDSKKLVNQDSVLYFRCRTHLRNTKYSKCSNHSMREDKLTNIIMEVLKEIFKIYVDKEKMQKIYENEFKKMLMKKSGQINSDELHRKLDNINKNLDKIYNDSLNDFLEKKDFERIYRQKKYERNNLILQINDFKKTIKSSNEKLNIDEFNKLLQEFFYNPQKSKLLIFSLIDRIEITKNSRIIIKFKFKELK